MKQSMQEFKKCFFDALQMMLEAFLPVLAKCSLFMSQLLGVLAFILFGIGGIWSVMGHGNEPSWWALKTLLLVAVSIGIYLASLLYLSRIQRKNRFL